MANHEAREWEWKGQKYIVQPGQMITSLKSIVEKCGKGITTQNVRTALTRFEKLEFLTNESTKQNRLITIENWREYQGMENEPNKETNNQLTNDQQSANNHLTTNKNDKNEEREIFNILKAKIKKEISLFSVRKLIKRFGSEDVKRFAEKIDESAWLKRTINLNKISDEFFESILNDEYKDYEKKEEVKDDKYDWYKPLDL